MNIIRVWSIIH